MSVVIQMFRFSLKKEFLEQGNVFSIHFPASWYNVIKKTSDEFKRKRKLDQLGRKIPTIQSNVIAHGVSDEVLRGEKPWLYIVGESDLTQLQTFASLWLIDKFSGEENLLNAVEISTILNEKLIAEPIVNRHELKHDFSFVSALMTYLFCQKPKNISFLSRGKDSIDEHFETLHFYPSFSGSSYQTFSNPILVKKHYFSYVVTFKYHTEPFTGKHYLDVYFSLRRWMSKKNLSLKKSHSLYVRAKGIPTCLKFTVKNKKDKNGNWYPSFRSKQEADMFSTFFEDDNITLKKILKSPSNFLGGENFFGIPYGENSFSGLKHNIKSGVSPQERKALYEALVNEFDFFLPVESFVLNKEKGEDWVDGSTTVKMNNGNYDERGEEKETVYPSINKMAFFGRNENLTLQIWEDKEDISQALKIFLENKLKGVMKISNEMYLLPTSNDRNVLLTIETCKKNGIDAALEGTTEEAIRNRKKIIFKLIEKTLSSKEDGTGIYSLFEMLDYSQSESSKDKDPKNLVRGCFMKQNIKTQFITPLQDEQSELMIRIESAFFDILSKWGFLKQVSNTEKSIYAYDVLTVKRDENNMTIPILSKISKDFIGYYFFDESKWYAIQDVLPKLEQLSVLANNDLDWGKIKNISLDVLKDDENEKILLLSSRLRNYYDSEWRVSSLKNENLDKDWSSFEKITSLSVVRYNMQEDVPTYLAFNDKGETTKPQGIFFVHPHIFYSVGAKPSSDKKNKFDTKHHASSKKFEQRRLLELVILTNSTNVSNIDIARIIHNSRNLSLNSEVHLQKDYTSYMIKHLNEYLNLDYY